jgi:general secretion pathway protein K
MIPKRKSERGIALLATMMAVVLMTIAIVDFTASVSLGYRAAANKANELRADYLARSGIQIGFALLAQDALKDSQTDQPYDGLDEPWAAPFPPVPVGGGTASVSIVDEERKLNINQLINPQTNQPDPSFAQVLSRLFQELGMPPELLPAIVDWLDPDSVPTPGGGAEADYYMNLFPPYQPRNGPMPTIGDLRMVKGVDDVMFMRLSQFLTVVSDEPQAQPGAPLPTTVNINTAPPEVIAALTPDLSNDPSLVKQIIEGRPWTSNQSLAQELGLPPLAMIAFTTSSHFFTITGSGTYAGTRKLAFAMIHRTGPGPVQLMNWRED